MFSYVFLGYDSLDDKLGRIFWRDKDNDKATVKVGGALSGDFASRHAVDPNPVVRHERRQGLSHFVHNVTRSIRSECIRWIESGLHRTAADGGRIAHKAGEGVTDTHASSQADAGSDAGAAGQRKPPKATHLKLSWFNHNRLTLEGGKTM